MCNIILTEVTSHEIRTDLKTDLKVKFTGTSDDVFTRLFNDTLDHGIGLGQTLKTFDQLGKIGRVLGLDSDTHDRRDRELHDAQVVGILEGGDGTSLDQELIDTDQTANVTYRITIVKA